MTLESAAIYLLGFIGFAAAGLLPYRSWLLVFYVVKSEVPQSRKRFAFIVATLVCAVALWSDFQIGRRVFGCLTEAYCGAGVASGWGYLAMLGVVYVAFEAVGYLLRKVTSYGK